MLKFLESNHAARPACMILAGLGAVLVVGSASTAFAQTRACTVTFSVTNATTLRALQFDVDYTGASDVGELTDPSECTFVPAGLGDVGVDQTANSAQVAWANTNPAFVGPGNFVACRFDIPLQASAIPSLADFVPSLVEAEESTGVPASPAPTLSTASISCVDAGSCSLTPLSGCKDPVTAGKSKLSFKDNADDTKDQGQYQWKAGALTDVSEFSDPTAAGDTWSWCVYSNGSLVRGSDVPSAGTCDGKPCWKAAGTTGFQFKGDVDGISQIKVKAGEAGKASVAVKGKSKLGNFSSPVLPLGTLMSSNVVSQVVVDNGVTPVCYENVFTAPSKNDEASYSSKD